MKKIIIIVTVPVVLETWLKGQAKFLSKYYEVEIITSYSIAINDIEKYENVSMKIFDFNRKINIFKDFKVLIQLFLHLIKVNPSIVYTLTPKAGLLGMISAWMANVPHRVHSVVGLPHLEATGKRKKILIITEKITYFFASNIYCNSLNLKKIIKNMTKKQVRVIGNGSVNGVDIEYFKNYSSYDVREFILNKLSISKNDFLITFVGRIVKDKGLNELLEAFKLLNFKYSKVKLLLVGDYKDETDLISRESQSIIKNNKSVIYLEFQEDIRDYLSITNLFVLPSYREGLPNVLIEAGSYGIPLLATNINGCNEVIEQNKNGVLVSPKNMKELYLAMEKFIVDENYYNYIKQNVRESIIRKYDQIYFWNELLNEFKKIETNK